MPYRNPYRALLLGHLRLQRHDSLLVCHDLAYSSMAERVASEARVLGIQVVVIHLTPSQLAHPRTLRSNVLLKELLKRASGVALLCEFTDRMHPARFEVLDTFRAVAKRGRAVSMPGIDPDALLAARSTSREMEGMAMGLARALLAASRLNVVTQSPCGKEHLLRVNVANRNPTPCFGTIDPGDWDNVPTGETFVLPQPRGTEGRIWLNGSIPGLVAGADGALLTIKAGRVAAIEGSNPFASATRELLRIDEEPTGYLTRVAEIGIGVNPSVKDLVGSPLVDEKAVGTIHVAFGRNDQLGGSIRGEHHYDLVLHPTRLETDCGLAIGYPPSRREIESAGDFQLCAVSPRARIQRGRAVTATKPTADNGSLDLTWRTPVGDPITSQVGGDECSAILASACDVQSFGSATDPVQLSVLCREFADKIGESNALRAVEVLLRHGILVKQ